MTVFREFNGSSKIRSVLPLPNNEFGENNSFVKKCENPVIKFLRNENKDFQFGKHMVKIWRKTLIFGIESDILST